MGRNVYCHQLHVPRDPLHTPKTFPQHDPPRPLSLPPGACAPQMPPVGEAGALPPPALVCLGGSRSRSRGSRSSAISPRRPLPPPPPAVWVSGSAPGSGRRCERRPRAPALAPAPPGGRREAPTPAPGPRGRCCPTWKTRRISRSEFPREGLAAS